MGRTDEQANAAERHPAHRGRLGGRAAVEPVNEPDCHANGRADKEPADHARPDVRSPPDVEPDQVRQAHGIRAAVARAVPDPELKHRRFDPQQPFDTDRAVRPVVPHQIAGVQLPDGLPGQVACLRRQDRWHGGAKGEQDPAQHQRRLSGMGSRGLLA
ncbi:MAG: hypothetical protein AB7L66_08065 [Gemmatimonadales bacterium]